MVKIEDKYGFKVVSESPDTVSSEIETINLRLNNFLDSFEDKVEVLIAKTLHRTFDAVGLQDLAAFVADGMAEPPLTAGPAALASAVRDATGIQLTEAPLRAEILWEAMQKKS